MVNPLTLILWLLGCDHDCMRTLQVKHWLADLDMHHSMKKS